MSATDAPPVDYRQLMKRVEQVVREIEATGDTGAAIHTLACAVIDRFEDALGIHGGRLYRWRNDAYELVATFPEARRIEGGIRVPASYPPVEIALAEGIVHMNPGDPRLDPDLEEKIGAQGFAAIELGDEEFLLAFDVARGAQHEDVLLSLGVLRHAINQKIRQQRMSQVFDEARKIQASILPKRMPVYGGFEFFGQTQPMESVGGDFYDLIPITDKILGLAIADVSGHGLPAALQVRDIYMGLRMGLARDLKIVRTVERLNQIIHRSTLTSRFVSMFYGELELSGVFIYVNAGHPPPFHLAANGEVTFLTEGGAVLGPIADATYERGFVRMRPGDTIVLYTDGVVEATPAGADEGDADAEYGVDRLIALTRTLVGRPAKEMVDAILADVDAYCGDREPNDDRTVLVASRPQEAR
ncbi:MAG: PP2C family protein-serine/threonine phosphatase [Acidobacteria bacterium]|nr:PP2C family protein-serine/threonine phosphatase [Acidobacteriota bacterium]